MKVRIKTEKTISNTTYHRRCSRGQQNWWLRGENGFVELPGGPHRGDYPLNIVVDLDPGRYCLGAGPAGKFGVRIWFDVGDKND